MRLISRNDASLVVGLIAGTVVIFQRPLRFVWEAALEVQERYHVDLLPALTIFAGVFIFHEARKRQQAKADARAAAAEAAQARMRSAELERLMTFSQALANALDPATLQQALWRYLPAFAGEREFWVLTRRPDRWETFLQDATATRKRSAGGARSDCGSRAVAGDPPGRPPRGHRRGGRPLFSDGRRRGRGRTRDPGRRRRSPAINGRRSARRPG